MKILSRQQKAFWTRNGYLPWEEPLLDEQELRTVAQRVEDIGTLQLTHVPRENFGYLKAAQNGELTGVPHYETLRKIDSLYAYDDVIRAICHKSLILDVVEDLIGPDFKLYGDQIFMKPPFHGVPQNWHQDSGSWVFFAPHDHVTVWLAIDEATVENGCLHYLSGSHKCSYVEASHIPALVEQMRDAEVLLPRRAGYGVFHHSLTLHYTGPNTTPLRRRGLAMHYIRSDTRYIGLPGEQFGPFPLMRGRSIPGRV